MDGSKVERSRYKEVIKDDGEELTLAFTPNTEGYNQSPNVRLLLTSWLSPEELQRADTYAFIGRAIALYDNGLYKYARYYGREDTSSYIADEASAVFDLQGAIVRGYVSHFACLHCDWGYAPRFIVPYIDGTNNVLQQISGIEVDDIGRQYALFKVVEGHKLNMDTYKCDVLDDKFVLSQKRWLTEPVEFNNIICPETGKRLSYYNAIKTKGDNGEPVYLHYTVAKEFKGITSE